jgi:hypothetical protein
LLYETEGKVTRLSKRKSALSFISEDTIRYRGRLRNIVVEVDRSGYTGVVRLEGTRQRFSFSFAGIYNHAVQLAVKQKQAEKRAAKREMSR